MTTVLDSMAKTKNLLSGLENFYNSPGLISWHQMLHNIHSSLEFMVLKGS